MQGKSGRGYFGIGVEGVSKSANVGALLRTAHAFGGSFCFTIGAGWDSRLSRQADTADTPAHVPLWRFASPEDLTLPAGCTLVGIELLDGAIDLPSFRHPLSAAYVLGPERSGLSPAVLSRCRHIVRIPTRFALNLAVAGALVLYDRLLQQGRYAERPVGSMARPEVALEAAAPGAARMATPRATPRASPGASPGAPPTPGAPTPGALQGGAGAAGSPMRHGPPRFRRRVPDWASRPADQDDTAK